MQLKILVPWALLICFLILVINLHIQNAQVLTMEKAIEVAHCLDQKGEPIYDPAYPSEIECDITIVKNTYVR